MCAPRPLCAVIALALGAACGPAAPEAARGVAQKVDEVVAWTDSIQLAETPEALLVTPVVKFDPRGGFLVADLREAQIRRYGPDGALLWHAGRKGNGPGEFISPPAVVRLSTGDVIAVDRSGRLTLFDSAGAKVLRTEETGLARVEDLGVVDDTTVLLAGVLEGDVDKPRLHLWSLNSNRILASFFNPLPNAVNRTVSTVAGWTQFAIRADTVAAIFATSDTVYLFTLGGRALGKVPLPARHFRRGPDGVPARTLSRIEQAEYLSQYDMVEDVYWHPDGSLFVPYQSRDADRALERQRHLVHVGRAGERLFETRNGPRLLGVHPGTGDLYFVHPSAELPNRWAVARVR
jgi:hypothetical protein